jgi:hypothetical protein
MKKILVIVLCLGLFVGHVNAVGGFEIAIPAAIGGAVLGAAVTVGFCMTNDFGNYYNKGYETAHYELDRSYATGYQDAINQYNYCYAKGYKIGHEAAMEEMESQKKLRKCYKLCDTTKTNLEECYGVCNATKEALDKCYEAGNLTQTNLDRCSKDLKNIKNSIKQPVTRNANTKKRGFIKRIWGKLIGH